MATNLHLWKQALMVVGILIEVGIAVSTCRCNSNPKPCSIYAGGNFFLDGSKCVYKRSVAAAPGSLCENWHCDFRGVTFCNVTYHQKLDQYCNAFEVIVVKPTTLPSPPSLQPTPTASPAPSSRPSATPETCVATTLSATDAGQKDEFGKELAVDGDVLVVGAHLRDFQGSQEAGVAYVYRKANGTWTQEAMFTPQGANLTLNHFGRSVAVSGSWILVGANRDGSAKGNAGSAYFYHYNSGMKQWQFHSKITANGTGLAGDLFGARVAISSTWAVVGAYRDENSGALPGEGSVYVYNLQNGAWVLVQKLIPPAIDRGQVLEFGSALALSGTILAVGAHGRASNTGAVYMFYRTLSEFQLKRTILAPDGLAFDEFGSSIALDQKVLVVGAPMADTVGAASDAGAAYVFRRDATGTLDKGTKILPADLVQGNYFGLSVGLSSDRVTVGAPRHSAPSGAVYSYLWDGSKWSLERKFGPTVSEHISAGRSTVISGTSVMFGVRGRTTLVDRVEVQCAL